MVKPPPTETASVCLNGADDDDSLQSANEDDDVEGAFLQAWRATSQDMLFGLAALAQWEAFEPGRTTAHVTVAVATEWAGVAVQGDPVARYLCGRTHECQPTAGRGSLPDCGAALVWVSAGRVSNCGFSNIRLPAGGLLEIEVVASYA